jgi:hypothetical protein
MALSIVIDEQCGLPLLRFFDLNQRKPLPPAQTAKTRGTASQMGVR